MRLKMCWVNYARFPFPYFSFSFHKFIFFFCSSSSQWHELFIRESDDEARLSAASTMRGRRKIRQIYVIEFKFQIRNVRFSENFWSFFFIFILVSSSPPLSPLSLKFNVDYWGSFSDFSRRLVALFESNSDSIFVQLFSSNGSWVSGKAAEWERNQRGTGVEKIMETFWRKSRKMGETREREQDWRSEKATASSIDGVQLLSISEWIESKLE